MPVLGLFIVDIGLFLKVMEIICAFAYPFQMINGKLFMFLSACADNMDVCYLVWNSYGTCLGQLR